MHVGEVIARRREAMGLTQAGLARLTGNSPGASYLSRIEAGEGLPSSGGAVRLADALHFPRHAMMNACGFATDEQQEAAVKEMEELLGDLVPMVCQVGVVDAQRPQLAPVITRQVTLHKPEDVFLVDLDGNSNSPYVGEVLVSRERKPREGSAVVAEVGGRLGAYVWHTSRTRGDWIVSGTGEEIEKFQVRGVIIRYTTAHDLDE